MLKELALSVPAIRRLYDSRNAMQRRVEELERELQEARALPEGIASADKRPFFTYFCNFDAIATMRRHEARGLQPTPGFQTNWLGVLIDPKIYPLLLSEKAGTVEPFPYPTNWHADVAEWAATLHAVDNAPDDSFTMIELGCGWGCWMNNTGLAAKRSGRKVHLIGIEGDEGHLGFAREALARNGFTPDEYTLLRGIAAASSGTALFPRHGVPGSDWGLEPVLGATEEQQAQAAESGSHDILPMVSLADAIGDRKRIDLLHIDIQGGEADFVEQCLPLIQEKVAYLVIGTHSKLIEQRLFDMLTAANWRLEMERPAFYKIEDARPRLWADGLQGWRNPALMRSSPIR